MPHQASSSNESSKKLNSPDHFYLPSAREKKWQISAAPYLPIFLDKKSKFDPKISNLSNNPELFEIYGRVALTGQSERFEIFFEPLGSWLTISVDGPEKEHFAAVFDNITEHK